MWAARSRCGVALIVSAFACSGATAKVRYICCQETSPETPCFKQSASLMVGLGSAEVRATTRGAGFLGKPRPKRTSLRATCVFDGRAALWWMPPCPARTLGQSDLSKTMPVVAKSCLACDSFA